MYLRGFACRSLFQRRHFLLYIIGYKEACIDEKLWRILGEKLGALLQKEFDERSEDDRLIIERILILVRNILEVCNIIWRAYLGTDLRNFSFHSGVGHYYII